MKGFLNPKLILFVVSVAMLTAAIAVPLAISDSHLQRTHATASASSSVTIPQMKLPWDSSLTNIPLTGGPHSGKDVGSSCVPETLSSLSGVDFGLSYGTDVLAAAAGTVFLAGPVSDSRGPYIVGIDHGGNFATEYWHLSSVDSSISVGLSVTQGRLLGKSGEPVGGAPHLHLEFRTGAPSYLTPLSAHKMPIDGYKIWTFVNTSTGKGYNYEGTMTRGTIVNKSVTACGVKGVKTWRSKTGSTIVANVNGMGGYLTSTNIETTGTTFSPGNLWVTGHDPDYHCTFDALQCHYLQVAVNFVTNGSTLPILALDHGSSNEVATAINSAFGGSGPSVTTVDPRTGFSGLPLVDSIGAPLYSAIVVASDITCGGCDNNDGFGVTPDSDAINARTADIAKFFNDGGGILALAGADNINVFYNFLPLPVTGVATNSPYTFTSVGLTLGLVEGNDDNCCPTHNSFTLPSVSGLQVAEIDNAGNAETIISSAVAARNWERPSRTGQQHSPNEPQNKPHH